MTLDKLIYNTYLKISRTQSGLPFRFRKQWEGFEESIVYPTCYVSKTSLHEIKMLM